MENLMGTVLVRFLVLVSGLGRVLTVKAVKLM